MKKNRVRIRLFSLALLLPLAFAARLSAQTATPALGPAEEAKIEKMLADSGVPSVSVGIVEHGKLVYAKAFGKRPLIRAEPPIRKRATPSARSASSSPPPQFSCSRSKGNSHSMTKSLDTFQT